MKKLSKLTVLLLALVMVLSLCACGKDDAGKALIGTWALDYDLADALSDELGSDYADFHASLKMTMLFEFNEDGTFRLYIDESSFTNNFNTWMDAFIDYNVEMMYDLYEDYYGLSREEVDEQLAQSGTTLEESLRDEMDSALDINALISEMESTGTYETKGDKLYLAEGSSSIDESVYDIFTVEGNKLTLNLPDGANASEAEIAPGLSYPVVLNKK